MWDDDDDDWLYGPAGYEPTWTGIFVSILIVCLFLLSCYAINESFEYLKSVGF